MSDLLPVLSRWAHVGAAVVLVGGTVFMLFALLPAAKELPEDVRNSLRERVMGTWRKFVGVAILLLLLSGIVNFYFVLKSDRLDLAENKSLYHSLMGVKIILAMVVFFLASALTGRAKGLEGLRQKSGFWLGLNLTLAAVIIAIAGYLKVAVTAAN